MAATEPPAPRSAPSGGGSVLTRKVAGLPGWAWGGILIVGGYFGYKWWTSRQSGSAGTITTTTSSGAAATPSANAQTTVDLPGGVSYQGPPWGLSQILSTAPVDATTPSGGTYEGPGAGLAQFLSAISAPAQSTTPTSTSPTTTSSGQGSEPTSILPTGTSAGSGASSGSSGTSNGSANYNSQTALQPGYGAGVSQLEASDPAAFQNTSATPTAYDPYPATFNGVPINAGGGTAPASSTPTQSQLVSLSNVHAAQNAYAAGQKVYWIPPGSSTPEAVPEGFQTSAGDRNLYVEG